MEITNLFYISILAITLYYVTSIAWRKLQNYPPGPFLWIPIIGHLHMIKPPPTKCFTHLANRFGPLLALRSGDHLLLVVSSPSAAEECLSKNDVVLCNRPRNSRLGKYMGFDYTNINFAPYGAHWINLRKISASEMLSPTSLQGLSGIRAEDVGSLVKRISKLGSGQAVNLGSLFLDTTMNIMTMMVMGKRYYGDQMLESKGDRLRQVMKETAKLLSTDTLGEYARCLQWFEGKVERMFKEFSEKRALLWDELIEEHKIRWNKLDLKPESKPFIQVLLELQDSDAEYYSDKLIHGIMLDMFIGGSITMPDTLEWTMSLLLNNPNVMKKAQKQIDNHVGYERFLNEVDVRQLSYLECIINEAMRMYPVLPLLLPHEATKDCIIGGFNIPCGTMILINAYKIQNDPNIWDEPEKFKPERFEGVDDHMIGYKSMPFGAGRRICPGEAMAVRVISLTIGSLIQCFEWERVDHELVDMTPLFDRLNLQKAKPLEAKAQARQVMINLLNKL